MKKAAQRERTDVHREAKLEREREGMLQRLEKKEEKLNGPGGACLSPQARAKLEAERQEILKGLPKEEKVQAQFRADALAEEEVRQQARRKWKKQIQVNSKTVISQKV